MKSRKELLFNALYVCHALIVWAGTIWQIGYVFKNQRAEDITVFWMTCLLLGELLALPRAIESDYIVWKACHIVASILVSVLFIGVMTYK